MRLAVESWAPEYGPALGGGELEPAEVPVNLEVEVPAGRWAPRRPGVPAAGTVRFVDGVRRIDARLWITGDDGATRMGICASYAAGTVLCDGRARLEAAEVRRELFSPLAVGALSTRAGTFAPQAVGSDAVEDLVNRLQERLGELEAAVAGQVPEGAGLVAVDGPLRGRQHIPGAVGYVKTHRVGYLPPAQEAVVERLEAGERTPLFFIQASWSRYSWYLRLPGPRDHPWSGVVRGEAPAELSPARARELADLSSATLPAFASTAHKDPRAPQNLYPIGGLERELWHRLGDRNLVYRSLRAAAG